MSRLPSGVKKRSDGTLEKRFSVNGKRYSVYGKNAKTLSEKELEIRERIKAGTYTKNSQITLNAYYKEWEKNRKGVVKDSTAETDRKYYSKHISPALGKIKIQNLEKRQVKNFYTKLQKKVATSTANLILSLLKTILNEAVRDGIISKSPAEHVKTAKNNKKTASETIHRALTREEQEQFTEEVTKEYYGNLLKFLLYTGMRTGEAAALTWNDIDTKTGVIHITKTVTIAQGSELTVGSPKSKAGKRDIPISNDIQKVLTRQREQNKIVSLSNPLVFPSPRGTYARSAGVNKAIKDTLNRLEQEGIFIEKITAHSLRATFATRFIENNGTPQVLKNILGHESFKMTMDLYSHVLQDQVNKEMQRISVSV